MLTTTKRLPWACASAMPQRQVGVVELVCCAPTRTAARLPGIYGIGAIGEGMAHGLEVPAGEEFRGVGGSIRRSLGWRRLCLALAR